MDTVVLTKTKVQSINDVDITDKSWNKLKGYAIRLGDVYACDGTHIEILETLFSKEELHYDGFIL